MQFNNDIPAVAITLASAKSDIQPLVLTNRFQNKKPSIQNEASQTSQDEPSNGSSVSSDNSCLTTPWAIQNFKVSNLRDWNIAMAQITLTCNFSDQDLLIPNLPNVSKYRGGLFPYLSCEDEIRIYAGYLNNEQNNQLISKNNLTEYIIDNNGDLIKSNPEGSLYPIFWGFIDKVEINVSEKGIFIVLSCRDRMRIFQDTRSISLDINQKQLTNLADGSIQESLTGDRIQLINKIVNSVTGNITKDYVTQEEVTCWREVTPGLIVKGYGVDGNDFKRLENPLNVIATGIKGLDKNEEIINPSLWLRAASHLPMNTEGNPRLHIWSERPPVTKGAGKAILQVLNQTPVDILNSLALTEERPIDFFASHLNGDIIFGPRSADFSGLNDPNRLYRTYYNLKVPENFKTCAKNQIISLKAINSTYGSYNNFLIVDSSIGNQKKDLLENTALLLEQYPYTSLGRKPLPPCRTQIIQDSTLDSWGDKNNAALIVGLNAARRWARDISAIQIKLLGDPTWYPGEIFQVWNTGIHDNDILITYNEEKHEQNIESFNDLSKNLNIKSALNDFEKNKDKTKKINQIPEIQKKLLEVFMNPNSRTVTKITDLNLKDLALPRYKVRSVLHEFSFKGFFTTIKGSADY